MNFLQPPLINENVVYGIIQPAQNSCGISPFVACEIPGGCRTVEVKLKTQLTLNVAANCVSQLFAGESPKRNSEL